MTWATGVMLVWGALCLVQGFRVRSGRSRTFYASYRTNAVWHNAALVLIPAGLWLIVGALAILASGAAVAPLALIAFVALILSFVWLFKPAEFLKPQWLNQVDSGARPEPDPGVFGTPSPSGARRIYLPPVVYWGLWFATGVVSALWLVLHWSPAVLVGLGAAVSTLLAHTPKKRSLGQHAREPLGDSRGHGRAAP